ncbi:MAG: hypothetical protein AAF663_01390 [Planctomycetota bacterium]
MLLGFAVVLGFVSCGEGATRTEEPATISPQPARWTEDFVESVGFVVKLHYRTEEFVEVIEPMLLETGVRYVRDGGIKDRVVENAKRLYQEHGIRFTMVADPRDKIMPDNVAETLILPFEGAVVAVEGPNEWDNQRDRPLFDGLVWPEHMQTYQAKLFDAIKNHDDPLVNQVAVLSPSLAHPHRAAEELGDLSEAIDFVNLHPYQGGALPMDQWQTKWLPGAHGTSTTKPIVITETGYHYKDKLAGQPGISEAAGARYVPRVFLEMFSHGVHRTHYYNFSADRWGEFREDGTPRPSVAAVGNLVTLLQDPPSDGSFAYEAYVNDPYQPESLAFDLEGGDDDLRHLLFQKRDGRFYLVLWLEKQSYDTAEQIDITVEPQAVELTLAQPAAMTTYLTSVSPEPVLEEQGVTTIALDVPDHPLVIEIRLAD